MKIAAVQFTPSTDPSENLEKMRHFAGVAAAQDADVIVFPEQTMALLSAVTPESLTEIAAEWWEQFVQLTTELAYIHNAVIVTAGFEPGGSTGANDAAALPFNTMIAISPDGKELARYRKLHLYHAFAASESDHTQAGTELPPVFHVERDEKQLTFGLANCYDVRFPEMFRSLVDQGTNVFILAAAWASGPGKEHHWSLLTQTRALENVSWLVASATVGGGSRNTATVGLSRVVDPMGNVVAELDGVEEGVIVAEVDEGTVIRSRAELPVIANRRIRLGYETR